MRDGSRFLALVRASVAGVLVACGAEPSPPADDSVTAFSSLYSHSERRYRVNVRATPAGGDGEQGVLEARVRSTEPWKLSLDFPYRLDLRFEERESSSWTPEGIDEHLVRFEAPLDRAADRPGRVSGKIVFGICRGEICQRIEHPFEGVAGVQGPLAVPLER
ncbi:MAG: hypothetical protein GY937_17645 [bacterium]|nr:hypothetical protein [bacterium]